MKCLSIILLFVFLLGCKMDVDVEKENPLAGTSWEMVSGEWAGKNTTFTFPNSPYDRTIWILGKTHWNQVAQDTSRKESNFAAGTYIIKGDSLTFTLVINPHHEDIGKSYECNFQIEGDKMVVTGADMHFFGHDWNLHQVWKKID